MSDPTMHGSSGDWNKLKHLVDLSAENASLKADVERLRKAGDDMAFHYQELVRIEWGQMTSHIPPSVIRWTAAKGGQPSV